MQTTTHLNFDGDCADAFAFYARIFGGEIDALLPWSDMPGGDVPKEHGGRIMHARLKLDGGDIIGADSPPDRHTTPQGFAMTMEVDSTEEAERLFAALGEGGEVNMEMTETFFAHRFGMVRDRFGIPWMVVNSRE